LPTEALEEIGQVANRPIVVDVERQVGVGGTGGFVVLTELVGTQAGRVTSRILNGESPASIPVTVTNAVRPVFDWRQLRRWNVDEAQLPPGSEIRFRELPFWRQYPWETAGISAALLVQASLIAALILEERRRRRAEAEKQGLVAELMHINRLATAGELTASIAHEVRQPLAAIAASGAAGLNWLRATTPNLLEIRAALQEIVESSRRADGVISSVLAMFRKNVPPGVVVNLNTVIEQVLALCSQKIDLERTSVEKRLSTSPAPLVMGEPVQLQQLFLNLIMNALEALSRAQSARVLTVSSACYGSDCFVRVQDSGPGIDPKLAGNIFRPFVTSKSDGIGLGLAICKSIVEAHGGEIRLLPALLSGTAFEVRIPAAPSAAS
jgi:C4-dicarboxylate-specific signal transduction histidine kinase